jgi:hypothetical protein
MWAADQSVVLSLFGCALMVCSVGSSLFVQVVGYGLFG